MDLVVTPREYISRVSLQDVHRSHPLRVRDRRRLVGRLLRCLSHDQFVRRLDDCEVGQTQISPGDIALVYESGHISACLFEVALRLFEADVDYLEFRIRIVVGLRGQPESVFYIDGFGLGDLHLIVGLIETGPEGLEVGPGNIIDILIIFEFGEGLPVSAVGFGLLVEGNRLVEGGLIEDLDSGVELDLGVGVVGSGSG